MYPPPLSSNENERHVKGISCYESINNKIKMIPQMMRIIVRIFVEIFSILRRQFKKDGNTIYLQKSYHSVILSKILFSVSKGL